MIYADAPCPKCQATGVVTIVETSRSRGGGATRRDPQDFDCPNGCKFESKLELAPLRKYA